MTSDFKLTILWLFMKKGAKNIYSDRQTRTRAIIAVAAFALLFLLTMLSVPDGALAAFERGLYRIAFAIFGVIGGFGNGCGGIAAWVSLHCTGHSAYWAEKRSGRISRPHQPTQGR